MPTTPTAGWYAHVEGKRWLRNDAFGPDAVAVVFTDEASREDTIVAWANKPYA